MRTNPLPGPPPRRGGGSHALSIGWIGTGRMGYEMAARLAKGGADVLAWNRTRAKAEPLARHRARIADKLS
ncbi:MAG TPA: NAD(P)-binding domain-containing protein, partial [Burkholderiales bacterium]|nr:NAD(P)-binding domain-containing protein [Burkholderiales bacterium]